MRAKAITVTLCLVGVLATACIGFLTARGLSEYEPTLAGFVLSWGAVIVLTVGWTWFWRHCARAEMRRRHGDHCLIPPEGWWCSRAKGHEGPCAAHPELSATQPERTCHHDMDEAFWYKNGDGTCENCGETYWTDTEAMHRYLDSLAEGARGDIPPTALERCASQMVANGWRFGWDVGTGFVDASHKNGGRLTVFEVYEIPLLPKDPLGLGVAHWLNTVGDRQRERTGPEANGEGEDEI